MDDASEVPFIRPCPMIHLYDSKATNQGQTTHTRTRLLILSTRPIFFFFFCFFSSPVFPLPQKKKNSFTFIHLSHFHHFHSLCIICILTLSSPIHSHSHSHSHSSSFAIPPRSPSHPPSRWHKKQHTSHTHIYYRFLSHFCHILSLDLLVPEFSFILLCICEMSPKH